MSTTVHRSDRAFFIFNGVISVVALAVLTWLLVLRGPVSGGTVDLRFMPAVNAALNGTAAVLLLSGFVAVRRGRPDIHRYLMVGAFVASSLFLVGYLAYHAAHGDTRFGGEGVIRGLYLALLASHVLLSIPVVPLALSALYFAWRRDFRRHTRVTRFLFPVWVYVSVTGVAVFFMLRPYYR